MAKGKIRALLKFAGKNNNLEDVSEEEKLQRSYRSINKEEAEKLIKSIYVPSNRSQVSINEIPSLISPIQEKLVGKKLDSERLFELAPEIEHASAILIPSILSPNDLQPNDFTLSLEKSEESEEVTKKIIEFLNEHFGKNLGITDKLPQWIKNALFKEGAKVISIIPESVIKNMRDSSISMESLNEKLQNCIASLEVTDSVLTDIVTEDNLLDEIASINEVSELITTNAKKAKTGEVDINNELSKIFSINNIKPIVESLNRLNNISISFDIRNVIAIQKNIIKDGLESFGNKFIEEINRDGIEQKSFKAEQFVDISEYVNENNDDNILPSMIELPTESVIPITIEGSPENHIGYFLILNENGIPLTSDYYGEDYHSIANARYENHSDPMISKMFDTFYSRNNIGSFGYFRQNINSQTRNNIVEVIYRTYLNKLIKTHLKNKSDSDVSHYSISMNNEISRVMFSRLLKNKRTNIVFLPKKFVTYLAFWYNNDGTGKSKIDNIKFPLSLKLTLIISRLMALMESAINKKQMNITLNENIPNVLEILRTIKKEVTKNKLHGISYDPQTIIKTILDKQLTIVPQQIPGVEQFEITNEEKNISYPTPDDSLLEEINNMYMLSLDVPPSALNRLGEDEFAKSVVTNNIFLSNKIYGYQKIICNKITELVKTYITYSSKIIDGIITILKDSSSDVISEEQQTEENLRERAKRIIRNIKMTLPSPNISNNMAQFEEVNNFINIIDTILNVLFPDDLVPDDEVKDTITSLKSQIKRDLVSDYIKSNSSFANITFPDIADIKQDEILKLHQSLINLKSGHEGIKNNSKSSEEESGGGGFGGGTY